MGVRAWATPAALPMSAGPKLGAAAQLAELNAHERARGEQCSCGGSPRRSDRSPARWMATTARASSAGPARSSRRPAADGYLAPADRAARGRSCRSETARSSHADWEPRDGRPDPIALLEERAADRVAELVPIRYGRMSASTFAFYRGAAYVMASDLAGTPQTGIRLQLCGDAHLANVGGFVSPERQLRSTSTPSTKPCRARGSGMPSGWLPACPSRVARTASRPSAGRRWSGISSGHTRPKREFAAIKTLDVWHAPASVSDLEQLVSSKADAVRPGASTRRWRGAGARTTPERSPS
jgi:hypothetical protein